MLTKCVCEKFLKARNDKYQITDLLQLSHKENESKIQCLCLMRRRHAWKKMHGKYANARFMVYAKLEGMLLKRQVQDAIFFYRLVKGKRIHAFDTYLEKLPPRSFARGASI